MAISPKHSQTRQIPLKGICCFPCSKSSHLFRDKLLYNSQFWRHSTCKLTNEIDCVESLFLINLILCIFIQNAYIYLKSASQASESNAHSLCKNALFPHMGAKEPLCANDPQTRSLGLRYPAEGVTGNTVAEDRHATFL